RVLERSAVEGVQHGVAGAVGSRTGAQGGALAVVGSHAAEWTLIDLAFFGARKRHPPVLEFVDRRRGITAQILDRVLVAKPVRPLHGVVHMPAPVVFAHIAERSRDAALRCNSMRAGGEHFTDAGSPQPRFA